MPTLLLIDDDALGLSVRAQLMRLQGYEVLTAETATEGAALLRSLVVDLVLLDYRLPDMSGSAALSLLKSISPMVPVVLVSGVLEIPSESCERAQAVVAKGAGAQQLLDTVHKLLQ